MINAQGIERALLANELYQLHSYTTLQTIDASWKTALRYIYLYTQS